MNDVITGAELSASNVWDGDEPTDVVLPGTCAFATLAQARGYGRWSKGFWIVAITGALARHGDDFAGEILVRDATVSAIVEQI